MSLQRLIIRHSGHWERSEYIDGDDILVHMSIVELTHDRLLQEIREQVGFNNNSEYSLFYLTNRSSGGGKIKVALKTDTDLYRMIVEQKEEPTVYVIEKNRINPHPEVNCGGLPSQEASIPNENIDGDNNDEPLNEEEVVAGERAELFLSLTTEFSEWIRKPGLIDKIIGLRSLSSDQNAPRDEVSGSDNNVMRNWEIPLLELESALPLGWVEPSVPDFGDLFVGSIFTKKKDLSIAVGMYHLHNRLGYRVDRSAKDRVAYTCKHEGCSFVLRASQNGSIWRIYKFSPGHGCSTVLDRTAPRQLPAKVIGYYYSRRLVTEGAVLKPREMMAEMKAEFGLDIDYRFALRSRNIAIEMTYGGFEKSYELLPSYLFELRAKNPGTFYDIQTSWDEHRLCYMFLALGQSIKVFGGGHLRPVIVVDGTHLKGKNKGILFVAVTKDGNEGIFPLAIGFGPIEDDESWTWFFFRLKSCFGQPNDLLIVSDGHPSIKNAIQSVYPNVSHGLCYYHIQKNLVPYGPHVAPVFQAAAYSYRDSKFNEMFAALAAMKRGGAHTRLSEIGIERWARSKCPVRRFSFMTSNPAETMNSRLLWARRLPICAMIETYRVVVEKWFDERRASAALREHPLTEEAFAKLSNSVEIGHTYTTRGTTTHVYKVDGRNGTYHVDLENKTCDCREFDLDLIPCRHACAAIRFCGLSVYDFTSRYYKQSTLLATYAPRITPVPHPDAWDVLNEIKAYIVRPAVIVPQAGRPRMSRARSAVEGSSSKTKTCTRCHEVGHNRKTCTSDVPIGGVDINVEPRRRKKKTCSLCGSIEHTKRRCPLYNEE